MSVTCKAATQEKDLKDAPIIAFEEFQKHDKVSDCWIQIEDMVFDVSEFMHKHPGGIKTMLSLGGRDATFPFQMNHQKEIWTKYLSSFFIGYLEESAVVDIYKTKKYSPAPELKMPGFKPRVFSNSKTSKSSSMTDSDNDSDSDVSESSSSSDDSNGVKCVRMSERDAAILYDYRQLWKVLDDEGYFITHYDYYFRKCFVYLILLISCIITFHLSNTTDSILLGCAAAFGLGMFFQQIAFIGHDLGHIAITHDIKYDTIAGFVFGNLLNGISVGWWKYTHNVHHIRTNDVVFDPDIQHLPIFAITVKYLSNVYSKFHDRVMAYDKAAQWFVKHQHILFIPIVLLARLNLHLQSFIFVIWTTEKNPQQKLRLGKWHKVIEILTLIGYFCWVCPLIYNTNHPVVYFFISHITAGILHLQILLNHFPCPAYDDIHPNFFLHQIQSSIDITLNRYTDWFGGGLQYQVEHHLFPSVPRHNLRKLKPMVQAICSKHNIEYRELTFWGAVKGTYNALKNVADSAQEFHFHTY